MHLKIVFGHWTKECRSSPKYFSVAAYGVCNVKDYTSYVSN
jgi:hypothetical protein